MKVFLAAALLLVSSVSAQSPPYTEPNCYDKQVIVHLFEWSWDTIANECEQILAPLGYCGVQVSPPQEHIQGDAWWTRYQPVSYILSSRSGNRDAFVSMVERCNAVGVNVIADLVINHMSGHSATGSGTGGSGFDGNSESYPAVPFSNLDFHQPYCEISNYQDAYDVRNCYLVGLNDLDGGKDYVRDKVAEYINDLVSIGVRGFRVDASKHMWPGDLEAILSRVYDVDGQRPFFVHEVIDQGGEAVSMGEYFSVGKVTEFNAGNWLACIRGHDFGCMNNYPNGLINGMYSLTFIDNHDNQRGHGGAGGVLTHKEAYEYKMASAFHLAQPYSFKRVMSSYMFPESNTDQGPPGSQVSNFDMLEGDYGSNCGNGWACEHRWFSIGNVVRFANAAIGTDIVNYQNHGNTIGFGRGGVGFIAIGDLENEYFEVNLPDGEYCDIIHNCANTVRVSNGGATFTKFIPSEPVILLCPACEFKNE